MDNLTKFLKYQLLEDLYFASSDDEIEVDFRDIQRYLSRLEQ